MRCYDYKCPEDGKTYFIPGCWSASLTGEKEDCNCYRNEKRTITPNEKILELQQDIKYWKTKYQDLKEQLKQ